MEIDAELLKDIISTLLLDLKRFDLEWRAHQGLFAMMNDAYPEQHLKEKLTQYYNSPSLQHELRQRYDIPREELLSECSRIGVEAAVRAVLESWNPRNRDN